MCFFKYILTTIVLYNLPVFVSFSSTETLQHGFHIQNDAEEHVRNLISNTVVWFMRDKNEIGRNLSTTGGGDSCAYVRCLIDLYVYQFGIETFNAAEYRIDSRTVACFRRKEDSYREKYASIQETGCNRHKPLISDEGKMDIFGYVA
ncbi:unnamed protein product [Heterobilharzia americana]|nr:unnamed protein product [Heterobilharzia americana]